jgi:hypothetical protein
MSSITANIQGLRSGNEKEANTVNASHPLSFNAIPSLD